MACSIALESRVSIGRSSTPTYGATAWIAPNWPIPAGTSGSRTTATRVTVGAICLRNSSHLPPMLYSNEEKPVALPLGRPKLATSPAPTGSALLHHAVRQRGGIVAARGARAAAGKDAADRRANEFRRGCSGRKAACRGLSAGAARSGLAGHSVAASELAEAGFGAWLARAAQRLHPNIRWRHTNRDRPCEVCSCPYLFQWRSLREPWKREAWGAPPDKPPKHSESRWGRERGRSIPFSDLPRCLPYGRYLVISGHGAGRTQQSSF